MPSFRSTFDSFPNETSRSTTGWTSKILYNFHNIAGVRVSDSDDVFNSIKLSGDNVKGSIRFPAKYFNYPTDHSARTIKVTMHAYTTQDGQTIRIDTGFYDVTNSEEQIGSPPLVAAVDGGGGAVYIRFECYYTPIINDEGDPALTFTGTAIFNYGADGRMRITPINNYARLDFDNVYDLYIQNRTGKDVRVTNLVVEEIG